MIRHYLSSSEPLVVCFSHLPSLQVGELHGDMSQARRLSSLEDFRHGRVQYLVATDIAARGLDIQGVTTVRGCPVVLSLLVMSAVAAMVGCGV
jgi:hypothetical protein